MAHINQAQKKIDDEDKKIPDTSALVKKRNARITKIEGNISNITGLSTTTFFMQLKAKYPGLVIQSKNRL